MRKLYEITDPELKERVERLRVMGFELPVGGVMREAFEIFKAYAGGFVVYVLAYVAIFVALQGAIFVAYYLAELARYPLTRYLFREAVHALILPGLNVGFFFVADKIRRGQTPVFADFFRGLSKLTPLFYAHVYIQILALLCMTPFAIFYLSGLGSARPLFDNAPFLYVNVNVAVFFVLNMIPVVYMLVAVSWTNLLIVFKDLPSLAALDAGRRVVMRSWWGVFRLYAALAGLNVLGAAAMGIGLAFTVPISLIAVYLAYSRAFED
jgi:hypothetical protein